MNRLIPVMLVAAVILGYLAGWATSPAGRVTAQQSPSARAPAWTKVALAPDQGGVVYWSVDALVKAHNAMASRAAKGQPLPNSRDLVEQPISRTHAWNFVHRFPRSQPPTAEQHEGVTDIYFITAGSGTVVVGGDIEGRQVVANMPGEYRGQPIKGGENYKVKAGDILSIPPNTPHLTHPDAGGVSYMLLKVNVGMYPWSIVAGQQ